MEPPTDSAPVEDGSIAAVVARLARWGRLAPHGLARVEFVSEFSRQRVVSELRSLYADNDIPFYEIELPLETPAAQIVTDLKRKFQSLEPGVVSLSGFETAFPPDIPLFDSLRLLNFNRENLADHPLRQIWWMTPRFAQEVVQSIPDLDSWFIVKTHLCESVYDPSYEHEWLFDDKPVPETESVIRARAEKHSAAYVERFRNALRQNASVPELLQLMTVATNALKSVREYKEASQLQDQLFDELEQAERSVSAYIRQMIDAPGNDGESARRLNNMAVSFSQLGRDIEAEQLHTKALKVRRQVFGLQHPTVAASLNNLASIYVRQARYAEAEQLYKESLQIDEQAYGAEHPSVGTDLNNLARLYVDEHRFEEAEALYARALAIVYQELGPYPRDEQTVAANYINLLRGLGRMKEADLIKNLFTHVTQANTSVEHQGAGSVTVS